MTVARGTDTAGAVGLGTGQHWDVIVIGTGMGGATLGHRLAMSGRRVLFCEQGPSTLAGSAALRGQYPEIVAHRLGAVPGDEARALFRSAGRHTERLSVVGWAPAKGFSPYIGAGSGGSSALYGMALERFSPLDFRPQANHPDAVDAPLDDAWPVSYEAMAPHYAAAEKLYRIRDCANPLGQARAARFRRGMHPIAVYPVYSSTKACLHPFILELRGECKAVPVQTLPPTPTASELYAKRWRSREQCRCPCATQGGCGDHGPGTGRASEQLAYTSQSSARSQGSRLSVCSSGKLVGCSFHRPRLVHRTSGDTSVKLGEP